MNTFKNWDVNSILPSISIHHLINYFTSRSRMQYVFFEIQHWTKYLNHSAIIPGQVRLVLEVSLTAWHCSRSRNRKYCWWRRRKTVGFHTTIWVMQMIDYQNANENIITSLQGIVGHQAKLIEPLIEDLHCKFCKAWFFFEEFWKAKMFLHNYRENNVNILFV